jgi:phosphatidylglycerophosphatase C
VQIQTSDTVWSRIAELARTEPGGFVATDGDGTLWAGDVGEDLFLAFLDHGRVEPPALEAIVRDARAHGLSDAGKGSDVARSIYNAYLEGRFPEESLCELMTWCFAGWTHREVATFARDVVDGGALASRFHPEVLSVVASARAAGVDVVLVSASPVAVVLEAASRIGFDPDHVVAASAVYDGEIMRPDVLRPIPYGSGKVTRLRERVGLRRPLYAALGDNAFDVAMLASARVPVAVRPKPRLREQAGNVPGIVELAR